MSDDDLSLKLAKLIAETLSTLEALEYEHGRFDCDNFRDLVKEAGLRGYLPRSPKYHTSELDLPFAPGLFGETILDTAKRVFGPEAVTAFGENNQDPPPPWVLVGYVKGAFGYLIRVHRKVE